MNFIKKDLEFLKVFQSCTDASTFEGDKLSIITEKATSKVYFTLFTDDIKMIEEKQIEVEEDFVLSILLQQFTSMLSFCKDNDIISISKGKIKFGSQSEYDFETFDFNQDVLKDLISASTEGAAISLKDVSKIENISFAIGQEKEVACIAYQDNHFIAYNGSILSFVKTSNIIEDNFYLPKVFYKLYQIFKFDEITLKNVDDKFFYLFIGNMKIFISVSNYSIPYIFDDDVKAKYEHQEEVIVNINSLKTALARIKVLNQKTTYNRVFVTFSENLLKLEIKDDFRGYENVISKKVDNSLFDFYIICRVSYLLDILNNCLEEDIHIKVTNSETLNTIKIEDNKNSVNHILTLYKKYAEQE